MLLLALLVPGAHTQAHAQPFVTGVSGSSGASGASGSGEAAEHDVLDTVLRPPARGDRRSTVRPVRQGPGPLPKPARAVRTCPSNLTPPPAPAPVPAPYVSHLLRTVVLRC
ncbi:hypothetical protein ACM01_17610 [Streptomyces viridochromogenes]|uniref:Secreted protein n=1 Tax=Streptomyces viridochromogenes TaxID=1938 RepID=A0A0J7ZE61_STRVR|nr:hypothetical protein ACM01_17610 [Streptomyces viridochromogenes]KOG07964.1 hypothetical protein ADK36_44255 [Streptomyces viridochromogenes]KOG28429.1 hypothetical protein ADK35_03675 [Streptomyces viridochromogenes]